MTVDEDLCGPLHDLRLEDIAEIGLRKQMNVAAECGDCQLVCHEWEHRPNGIADPAVRVVIHFATRAGLRKARSFFPIYGDHELPIDWELLSTRADRQRPESNH